MNYIASQKEQIPFSMAIGNVELMHECFPKVVSENSSKNEVRQRHRGRRQEENSKYREKYSGHERNLYGLAIARASRPLGSLPTEAVSKLPN